MQVEKRLSSSSTSDNNSVNLRNVAPPPDDASSLPLSGHEYPPPQFGNSGSDFNKHAPLSQDHTPTPDTAMGGGGGGGVTISGGGGGGGGGMVMSAGGSGGGGGSGMDGKAEHILHQPPSYHHNSQNPGLMSSLLDPPPSMQGLSHGTGSSSNVSQHQPSNAESFRGLLSSQDDSGSLQQQPVTNHGGGNGGGMRYSTAGGGAGGKAETSGVDVAARSLSHPNLSSIPGRTATTLPPILPPPSRGTTQQQQPPPHTATSSTVAPAPHQPPLPFPANLGGFALSSMVGHFTSHPQLQAQSLSMNPAAGGLMPGLGISVGGGAGGGGGVSQTQPSNALAPGLSLSNHQMQGMLGATPPNPSISLMSPPAATLSGGGGGGGGGGGTGRSQTLPPSNVNATSLPMPLTHPIAGNLQNPTAAAAAAGLPLLPGMPNMYSYPYTAGTLPAGAQPAVTSSIVHPAGFPSQSLVQGYSQYLPPSLYGNAPQQPPVSTGNFSR